ncbi:MAG: hypothetical protein LWX83_08920 [Anaerolineae bacterium]|nr:hypothetical protein [Anaerolineae bacterium]
MLNLLVMVRSGIRLFFLFFSFLGSIWPQVNQAETPRISAPTAGQAVKGAVLVSGFTDIKNFQSAEVSYSYTSGDTSWFLISQSSEAVKDGQLTVWDTSTITDGDYNLRLQVILTDGSVKEDVITVRVRNYSPVETVGVMAARPTATPTAIIYRQPTPTRLPANPASVTPADLDAYLRCGVISAVVILTCLAIYMVYKRVRSLR